MLAVCIYLYVCGLFGFGALVTIINLGAGRSWGEAVINCIGVLLWPFSVPLTVAGVLISISYDEWAFRQALRGGR